MDLPPPSKKARASAATPRSKPARPSVPWANGALTTPAPPDDAPIVEVEEEDEENEATTAEIGAYQQVCGEGWGSSSDWHNFRAVAAPALRAAVNTELSNIKLENLVTLVSTVSTNFERVAGYGRPLLGAKLEA